jgi:hypothetical protein
MSVVRTNSQPLRGGLSSQPSRLGGPSGLHRLRTRVIVGEPNTRTPKCPGLAVTSETDTNRETMRNVKPLSVHPFFPVFQPALASLESLTSGRALCQISLTHARAGITARRNIEYDLISWPQRLAAQLNWRACFLPGPRCTACCFQHLIFFLLGATQRGGFLFL